ncbi:hypothetical protein [Roseovarius litoreus]|uniref:hypothetical protein n=1 Tax=Roseovarius litoreus TaxID=1155722 RepID=UPI00122C9758|nr:hypothetical protein [Roseovarius litoreus]
MPWLSLHLGEPVKLVPPGIIKNGLMPLLAPDTCFLLGLCLYFARDFCLCGRKLGQTISPGFPHFFDHKIADNPLGRILSGKRLTTVRDMAAPVGGFCKRCRLVCVRNAHGCIVCHDKTHSTPRPHAK